MCTVSAVTDHYQRQWPLPNYMPPFNVSPPNQPPVEWVFDPSKFGVTITQAQWAEYQRLKKAAEEIDAITGQPDCVKPGVDAWEKAVAQFVGGADC